MLKENIARHSQYCFFREFWGVLGDRDNREQGGESILSGVGDKGIRANFVDGRPISIALQADEFSRAHRRSRHIATWEPFVSLSRPVPSSAQPHAASPACDDDTKISADDDHIICRSNIANEFKPRRVELVINHNAPFYPFFPAGRSTSLIDSLRSSWPKQMRSS